MKLIEAPVGLLDCDGYCLSDDIEDYLMEMEALKDAGD